MKTQFLDIEKELIRRCIQGDQKSQKQLYEHYAAAMYGVSRRIIADEVLAEDAMQEAFITAFQKLEQFKGEVVFGAWLKRIVIRKSIDLLRKERKLQVELENDNIIEETSMDYKAIDVQQLKSGIEALPAQYKLMINLYYFEEYCHEELASLLGISHQNSRTLLSRAKSKLKTILNEMQYGRSIG